MDAIGTTTWVIMNARVAHDARAEPGRLPRPPKRADSDGVLVLNTNAAEVRMGFTIFPTGGGGSRGPYEQVAPAATATFIDFRSLPDVSTVAGDFCAVVESDRPVVVQHVASRGTSDGHVVAWSQLGYAAPTG